MTSRRTLRPLAPARALGCALALIALFAARGGHAATISVEAHSQLQVGHSLDLDISLDLAPGEVASVFEGHFALVGVGSVVGSLGSGDLLAGGPTWDSAFGSVSTSQLLLSLTSSNTGGSRLVGKLHITGLASGIFQIELASGTFAQRDIAGPPFVLDVPITTPPGSVLAQIQINAPQVPALGAAGELGLAAALAASGRRRRRAR